MTHYQSAAMMCSLGMIALLFATGPKPHWALALGGIVLVCAGLWQLRLHNQDPRP